MEIKIREVGCVMGAKMRFVNDIFILGIIKKFPNCPWDLAIRKIVDNILN